MSDKQAMSPVQSDPPKLVEDASFKVIYPITGMMGGLLIGVVLMMVKGSLDQIEDWHRLIQYAVWGFFLGLAVVLLTSLSAKNMGVTTVKRLAALIAVAAVICWFGSRILVEALTW